MVRKSRTWWGEVFLDVLEGCMDEGRLRRGRSYSGPNRLLEFEIAGSKVRAVMRGNINPYFGVYKEPRYKVSVETGKSLLPHDSGELISTCSCPDRASPCKHVAGVYYKIASLLDRDLMLLFQLRGMSFDSLQKRLSQSPLARALTEQRTEDDIIIEHHSHRFSQPAHRTANELDPASFWKGSAPLPHVAVVSKKSTDTCRSDQERR